MLLTRVRTATKTKGKRGTEAIGQAQGPSRSEQRAAMKRVSHRSCPNRLPAGARQLRPSLHRCHRPRHRPIHRPRDRQRHPRRARSGWKAASSQQPAQTHHQPNRHWRPMGARRAARPLRRGSKGCSSGKHACAMAWCRTGTTSVNTRATVLSLVSWKSQTVLKLSRDQVATRELEKPDDASKPTH